MHQRRSRFRQTAVIDGCRIPFQKAGTGYQDLDSYDLARMVLQRLLRRTEIEPTMIDRVIMGRVVSSLRHPNVARDAALAAGILETTPALTVSQACISANVALTTAMNLISSGEARVVIAGGTESLSDIPVLFKKPLRRKFLAARKFENAWDYRKLFRGFQWNHLLPEIPSITEFSTERSMGEDADRLAARFSISREEQDEYALRSHRTAAQAEAAGFFRDEVEKVRLPPDFSEIGSDNGIRPDTSRQKLKKLPPAFVESYGSVTAGNSSFLTDGSAALLLIENQTALDLGLKVKAILHSCSSTAQDPGSDLLMGPAYAVPRVLEKAELQLQDIDVFEFHEAFAAQVLANLKALGSSSFARQHLGRAQPVGEIPLDKLNILGGSLSLGHPFGATGARLVLTAANRLERSDGKWALVASCAAGGLGSAIVLERPDRN